MIPSDVAAGDLHSRSVYALHGLFSAQIAAGLAAANRSIGFIEDHNAAISTAESV